MFAMLTCLIISVYSEHDTLLQMCLFRQVSLY
jgi:hypothetical protein